MILFGIKGQLVNILLTKLPQYNSRDFVGGVDYYHHSSIASVDAVISSFLHNQPYCALSFTENTRHAPAHI